MKIALLSSFNADLLPPWLARCLQESQIKASFYLSGFDQYRQEILDPDSSFYQSAPDVVILLLDCQDMFADLLQLPFDSPPENREARIKEELNRLRQFSEFIHKRLPGTTLFLNTFAAPPTGSLGLLEYNSPYAVRGAMAEFNAGLAKLVRHIPQTYIVDCEALAVEIGWREWFDERLWLLGRMRLGRTALELLAKRYSSAIRAASRPPKKVLALDADNTLWGGSIGTDGLEGIQLGYEGIGLAYQQFQLEVLNLYKRGVLLALVSKNNRSDIEEALNHPAMLLKREHFAALTVNWQDKAGNLRQIAEQLNLGLDSFAFVDDSPFECAWVKDQLPDVQVLQLPEDPIGFVQALRESDAFATLNITGEDLARGQIYREDLQRKELQQSVSTLEDFYASLEIRVVIRPLTLGTLTRVAQLTQKTNQFNLTTRRYSIDDISRLAEQVNCEIYTLAQSDRFGDNGLVGVAILCREEKAFRIDTFLLSCRVMGRTVETAFLAFLARQARKHDAHYLVGEYLPTAKNQPVQDLYRQHGFSKLDVDGHLWRFDLQAAHLGAPDYIMLDLPKEE